MRYDSRLDRKTAGCDSGVKFRSVGPGARGPSLEDNILAKKVRTIQRARADRARLFDAELFGEPAWEDITGSICNYS